jgi:hypothetical protein
MAIGDTVQAGLMRFDSSAYERAGQANANANAALGNALNVAAKGFFEGQEKKARAKEIEEDLIRSGEDPAAAKAISKNPFLQKEYQRKKATEAQMQIEGNRLAQRARETAAQSRDASEKNKLSRDEFDLKKDAFGAQQELLDEVKESEARIGQFMLTPTEGETPEFRELLQKFEPEQIPGTPEFKEKELSEPMGARAPIMASYETMKPDFEMFEQQAAPGVARLPERFQPMGQNISDAVAQGKITEGEGLGLLGSIEARAIAETPKPMTYPQLIDLQNKITAEQRAALKGKQETTKFNQEQSFLTFTPENNFLAISNGGKATNLPISGVVGNEKLAGDLKNEISAFNDMDQLFSRLITLSDEEGWVDDESLKTEANGLVRSIQGRIRENVLGPGTVTDSERAILDQIVTNPYSKTMLLSTRDKVDLLQKLRTQITNNFQNKLTNVGLQVGQSRGGASPSNSSIPTRDGSGVDFIDLSQ